MVTSRPLAGSPRDNLEKPELGREQQLADFWRGRSGLKYSDFDAVCGVPPPAGLTVNSREPAYDVQQPNVYKKANADDRVVKDIRHSIAHLIAGGYPLSFGEYHLAIAFGFLLADGILYDVFFTQRWHETEHHRSYGPGLECPTCQREKEKAGGKGKETPPYPG